MRAPESIGLETSIIPAPGCESRNRDSHAEPGPGSGSESWFYDCALGVFGDKETGSLLHLATGWPRTSCYAMVARDPAKRRSPSSEFLRALFHSPHGQPFHDAFMHGCSAPWWIERQREQRLAAVAERFKREIEAV